MTALKKIHAIDLQEGDLLFKRAIDDAFAQAIVASTQTHKKLGFNHVGVAVYEDTQWYVIEAITQGVCKTPIEKYAYKSTQVVVARLKAAYQHIIPQAITCIKQQIGKPYDVYYSCGDAAFYCSELVQKFYLLEDGAPIFEPIKMTFKDVNQAAGTQQYIPYWVEHFKKLNYPIPEGRLGSNPNQLLQSEKIEQIAWLNVN